MLSMHDSKTRKYKHTLEMIQPEVNGVWVGVHSALANKCVAAMLAGFHLDGFQPYQEVVAEVALREFLTRPSAPPPVRTRCGAQAQSSLRHAIFSLAKSITDRLVGVTHACALMLGSKNNNNGSLDAALSASNCGMCIGGLLADARAQTQ